MSKPTETWQGCAQSTDYGAQIGVLLTERTGDHHYTIARVVFEPHEDGVFPGNSVEGSRERVNGFLLACVDAAAQLGLVPARNKDSADELAAIRGHLKREQGTLDRLLAIVEKGAA